MDDGLIDDASRNKTKVNYISNKVEIILPIFRLSTSIAKANHY
ncbi:hypothetical protein JCM19240_412 [Vibrio maritimus]|uniref:Uncharacterized protein n=1 Tax=Vibrio maritimus TaxID=990268 RepID=A0A090T6G6_9VIBR|nr:hypothetical protein JCM19240_412 [Vibrio maritimus]